MVARMGRLQVSGWFGAAASTHWLATQCAMATLEKGGNAFDGAVVGGFVMQVAQPHLNGPAGDVALMTRHAATDRISSFCGQGPTPARADIAHFQRLGYDLIPGTGLLPAVVPGAFDCWMKLLAEHGTIGVEDALAPAIFYAENGVPIDQRLHETLSAAAPMFSKHWSASAAQYLTAAGDAPPVGGHLTNARLGATLRRISHEARAAGGARDAQIAAARAIWSDGFIAERIDAFCRHAAVMDVSGRVNSALLSGDDLSGWRASEEPVISAAFAGRQVHKCGSWTQGPVLLQALGMLDPASLAAADPVGPAFVHDVTEALKLAMADRDAHYGASAVVTLARLLSEDYASERRGLIGAEASHEPLPGRDGAGNPAAWTPDYASAAQRQREAGLLAAYGGGEPTIVYDTPPASAPMTPDERRTHRRHAVGDTSYLSVADSHGNVVSATPSGGWLQSSPVIPDLGFCLGTRAQMMWLDDAAPSALRPKTRPRTTLTPSLVSTEEGDVLAVGTPGGDQQDQWQLTFLLRHLLHGMPLQEALDAPGFHTNHLVNSFYPRGMQPRVLVLEDRFDAETQAALRACGHEVTVVGGWSEGRLCAVRADADGGRHAAVTQRGGQALAVAR